MARKSKATKPEPPLGGTASVSYLTDKQVEALGMDPATAGQAIVDSSAVYEHVSRTSTPTRDDLVHWANDKWGSTESVDRLNAALDYLLRAGKLIAVP